MMALHLSSRSTSVLTSMSKVSETTLTTQAVASSTHRQKANAERKVIATKVTGPPAGLTTDRFTLPRLFSSLKELIEEHTGLNFLTSQHDYLLSPLVELFARGPHELRKKRE